MGLIFRNVVTEDSNYKEGLEPTLVDTLTKRLCAAIHTGVWVGFAENQMEACPYCDAQAPLDTCMLPLEGEVGSLALHTIACHRSKVPETELAIIETLTYGEHTPTHEELLL